MYNPDTELLFPSRVIPALRDLRGAAWRELCQHIHGLEHTDPDHLAYVLMMIKLNSCITCNSDSFRAMRGCTACASQNVRRYRDDDEELVKLYEKARKEVEKHLAKLKGTS